MAAAGSPAYGDRVQCAQCGKDNRDDARYCRGCGASLSDACGACGATLLPDAAFCDRCGAAARATPAAPTPAPSSYTPAHLAARIRASRAALEGERKLVTVLFADVVGSTSIAERIDPEEMRTLMDRCFGHMLEEVHRYEGTVNQFTGDGVMALFGAPLALEEAPRRAVMSALAIQRALARCRAELQASAAIDLQVRIGIHTGLVVVGRIGNDLRMEYTAIGDTTNLAARLQTLADPGAVVMSEATYRLAGAFFETRDLGLRTVKGKSEAVRVYEVTAARSVRGPLEVRADRGLTPLAGRTRELAALGEAFEAACAGRGQVVFVVGEAGIGKSRLLHEFRRSLDAGTHTWVEGRCASYGRSTAFLPLVDMWRRSLAIEDHDDEAAAIAKVDAGIDDLAADLAWTKPFIRRLLSLGEDATMEASAATRRAETFRALKALTLRAAERQPVVLVVEDLHWIDTASEEYLAFLADAVPTARVLLVLTHRPGHRQPFGDRSYHRRITLGALERREMAAMTSAILDASSLPDELSALIAAKAEGNPLFVEEVTKSLLEEGVLRRDGDRIELARALADVAVPDSIQGVLMARLDRLEEGPKHALQMASVIGREFALRLLARVTEVGEGVSSLVAELRALELIYEKTAHPELAYMFKHALTHDVAYESILHQRRRELHRMIGTAIEELYDDRLAEHYETLALHFSRAEDWARAFEYHGRAAEKALATYASDAVVFHCREALRIAERLGPDAPADRRRTLEEMLGAASFYRSAFLDSADAYVRAAGHAPRLVHRAEDLVRAGEAYTWAHRYETAGRTLDEAVRLARTHGFPAVEALGLAQQAFRGVVMTGDLGRYGPVLESAVRTATEAGSEEALATARSYLFEALEWRGRYHEAIAVAEEVAVSARRLRLAHLVIWSDWFIAKASCCLGDYGRAISMLGESVDLCQRIGDRVWRTRMLNTTGWVMSEFGAERRSRAHNDAAIQLAREVGDSEIIANTEINLALNHVVAGELDDAAGILDRLHAETKSPGDPWMRWRWSMHVDDACGRLALARRDPAAALAFADAELATARRFDARKIEGRAEMLRARALLALERLDDAEGAITAALDVATAIAYPAGQWRALRLRAEAARRRGDGTAVAAAEHRLNGALATLATSLPDDELRRVLYAAAAGQASA
jgi:class 3 adenylate cyclase/tetratricopeptide (TPR) repeat protein